MVSIRPGGSPADVALKTRLKELLGDVPLRLGVMGTGQPRTASGPLLNSILDGSIESNFPPVTEMAGLRLPGPSSGRLGKGEFARINVRTETMNEKDRRP
jgi:hypothetical protein